MKTLNFRELNANEVSVRAARCGDGWAQLLLYEDARTAMDILDETVGQFGWQRRHSRDNANCTIAIYCDELQQWIEKEDVGVESNTEKEKGLSSDSFKRAAVNWGIGRSLYTSPDIFIKIKCENKNGRYQLPAKIKLNVTKYVVVDGIISVLEIVGSDGKTYFTFDDKRSQVVKPVEVVKPESKIDYSCCSTGSTSTKPVQKNVKLETTYDDDYVIDMPDLFPEDDDMNMFPEVELMDDNHVEEMPVEAPAKPVAAVKNADDKYVANVRNAYYASNSNGGYVKIIYEYKQDIDDAEQFQPLKYKKGVETIVETLRGTGLFDDKFLSSISLTNKAPLEDAVAILNKNKDVDLIVKKTKNARGYDDFTVSHV